MYAMHKLMSVYLQKNVLQRKSHIFQVVLFVSVAISVFCGLSLLKSDWHFFTHYESGNLFSLDHIEQVVLPVDGDISRPKRDNCSFWSCVNPYICGQSGHDKLLIYVYPIQEFVDTLSKTPAAILTSEYFEILRTVVQSKYYTSNPNEACLYLPSIDLLNYRNFNSHLVNRALASLTHWNNGKNHLLFNMLPGVFSKMNSSLNINSDLAIILGGGFSSWTYRIGFDVALPVWSPYIKFLRSQRSFQESQREILLIIAQLNVLPKYFRTLRELQLVHPEVLLLQTCNDSNAKYSTNKRCTVDKSISAYEYPNLLKIGTFCLLTASLRLGQPDLLDMLALNCIPVIAADNYVLPFEEVLDWSLVALRIEESKLNTIVDRLRSISQFKIIDMQRHGRLYFDHYFKDLRTITLTALKILEDRIFAYKAINMRQWSFDGTSEAILNPLFLPLASSKSQGFTAVILTYDRLDSLLTLIHKLSLVSSLQSILVVWNNPKKIPPPLPRYTNIMKPIKVIHTKANKLSNRFYPYAEIETEAILTIDDDIVMLTADELDFGFEVWREFPDRIVGFPSRIHLWDNTTMRWHYESEWKNKISMVLTGAAFHHKFWSHMYTNAMPGDIKKWVDEHMNCEDIAMNFLVSNITNKPPIKVTPRKKFKCPECTNTEMLSADLNHMRERSYCIDHFSRVYGRMPLKSVEFRADPVLYRDNFPEKLKRFNDVGSL